MRVPRYSGAMAAAPSTRTSWCTPPPSPAALLSTTPARALWRKYAVYMAAYLHIYKSIHGCISTYLHIYISTCLHIYVSTCLHVCISTYLHIYVSTCLHIYVSTYLHVCISTYLHIFISTCLHIYISIHVCISTYLRCSGIPNCANMDALSTKLWHGSLLWNFCGSPVFANVNELPCSLLVPVHNWGELPSWYITRVLGAEVRRTKAPS